jgi:hypothetical protein
MHYESGWFILYEIILCGVALICSTALLLLHRRALVNRWWSTKVMQQQDNLKTSKWHYPNDHNTGSHSFAIITALLIEIDQMLANVNFQRHHEDYIARKFAFADHLLLVLFQLAHLGGTFIILSTT